MMSSTDHGASVDELQFSLKSVFMVDVRFELTTNDPSRSFDDVICEGISWLGYGLMPSQMTSSTDHGSSVDEIQFS